MFSDYLFLTFVGRDGADLTGETGLGVDLTLLVREVGFVHVLLLVELLLFVLTGLSDL